MERLTQKDKNGHVYVIGCPSFDVPKEANKLIQAVADKCYAIENILGDDYDLDRLRDLVEADRDGRCMIVTRCHECENYREVKIRKLPAADVAPVVRCRECKHWGGVDEYGDGYCKNPDGIDNIAKENDFCSYGEKANYSYNICLIF